MEIKFTSDFDHNLIEDAIKNSKNSETTRKTINFLSEVVAKPAQDIVKTSFFFKKSVDESMHMVDKEGRDVINEGIYLTFVASVFGNLISMFNLSEERAINLVKDVIRQNSNIKKQERKEEQNQNE